MSIAITPVRGFVSTIREQLRERRAARARYDSLKRELASYRTPGEVNDLLGVVMNQDGPAADEIRDILLHSLRQPAAPHRI